MDVSTVTSNVQGKRMVMYSYATAATVVLYDTILNFPREIEYIWKRKWSFAKVLYLLCRYYSIVTLLLGLFIYPRIQTSLLGCRVCLYFVVVGEGVALQFVISMITIMRIYALYGRSSKFLYTILTILTVNGVGELFTAARLAQWYARSVVVVLPGTPWATCRVLEKEIVYTTSLWALVLGLGSLLFILTLIKYIEGLRKLKYLSHVPGAVEATWTPILAAFYTSGTIWYFALIVVMVVYAVMCSLFSDLPRLTAIVWVAVVQSISGSRLILDVREAGHADRVLGEEVTIPVRTGPAPLVFDRPQVASFTSTFFDLES